ncbi:GSU2403 family nucleotidyltransferase fold protein [Seongchinamella sediminis]|uniref:GSU2403 family nucleotidyltransferase fold protein n=1 Tax=Seongchinamella sediminis TaxID=2283635 RepID=UPI003B8358A9
MHGNLLPGLQGVERGSSVRPVPGRFALHKLVVAQRRNPGQRAKSIKDVKQAKQLIAVLLDQRPADLWLALDAAVVFHDQFAREMEEGIKALDDEALSAPLLAQLGLRPAPCP